MSENNKYSNLLDEWNKDKTVYFKEDDRNKIYNCFQNYISKIQNTSITLIDYAGPSTGEDCSYLTTFIETKSRKIYGSAKPGNMYNNGISYKSDDDLSGTPYYIGYEKSPLVTAEGKKITPERNGKKLKEITLYSKEIAEEVFNSKFKPFLKDIVLSNEINTIKNIESTNLIRATHILRKIVAMNNIGKFLYIYSNEMINVLYKFFVTDNNNELTNIEKNKSITESLKELGFKKRNNEEEADYIINLSHFIWEKFDSTIDINAKNIILHGAPGTGKTYMTDKSIVNNLSILNNQNLNKQYKLVQFHPSFGYEEFIDGIKPVISKNSINGIELKLVNGIFKEMCIDAFKELIRFNQLSKEDKKKDEIKKFYFVADEINRAELSRVFGELLLCLEEDKRLSIEKNKKGQLSLTTKSTKLKTQNASLWEKEHAVLIMDKETIFTTMDENSNYVIEQKDENQYDYYFGVPENLYFIGTMNDIDRSVDSFDMALRRRFVWKHYSYKKAVLEEHYDGKAGLSEYLEKCEALNNYIISEKGFGLSESYMLGHSYFMNLYSFSDDQLKKLWSTKIEPLLIEYARINYEDKELKDKLECTKKIFLNQKMGEKCK